MARPHYSVHTVCCSQGGGWLVADVCCIINYSYFVTTAVHNAWKGFTNHNSTALAVAVHITHSINCNHYGVNTRRVVAPHSNHLKTKHAQAAASSFHPGAEWQQHLQQQHAAQ